MQEKWSDLAKQFMWEINPQTNYHGTPYVFDKFNDSKFLTGEGAMAHGPGHYSADYYSIANKYNPGEYFTLDVVNNTDNKPINLKDSYKLRNNVDVNKDDIILYLRDALQRKNKVVSGIDTYRLLKEIPEVNNVLDNLRDYKVIKTRHIGNTYNVNVPNENFMWKEGLPLEQQSNYIKNIVKNNNSFIDYSKYIPDDAMNYRRILYKLDLDKYPYIKRMADFISKPKFTWDYPSEFNDKHKDLIVRMLNKIDVDDQMDLLNYFKGNSKGFHPEDTMKDAQRLYRSDYGVKGIRARGTIDGPINVTFSGDDIRMANTPWQRFVNRIPKQTLGKMASKLYNTPGVKQTIRFADRVATPLMILEGMGLNQPVGQGSDQPPIYPVNGRLEGYITNEY